MLWGPDLNVGLEKVRRRRKRKEEAVLPTAVTWTSGPDSKARYGNSHEVKSSPSQFGDLIIRRLNIYIVTISNV